jgi:hypothetical protein
LRGWVFGWRGALGVSVAVQFLRIVFILRKVYRCIENKKSCNSPSAPERTMSETGKSLLSTFRPPANQQDFPDNATLQAQLIAAWTNNLGGFTQQGIVGNPWNATYSANNTLYFNPLTYVPPSQPTLSNYAPIPWEAFPGRIGAYMPNLTADQARELADTGYYIDNEGNKQTFAMIPQNPCDPQPGQDMKFAPYGPRGWQDEYCEWSVTRDANGKITRIDVTCENPEYWNTLWNVSPQRVLELYQQTLNKPQIALDDLCLRDSNGKIVVDPSTGNPSYNPLNKWNAGPSSTSTAGGAMHLTSTPNTIQTEIGLGAAATTLRQGNYNDPGSLICCAQYGQLHRNSDPNIGFSINGVVQSGATATLANPPGLYIQMPDFSGYKPPAGHESDNVSQFWRIVRGTETLVDEWGNTMPGNYILHAVFEVPADKGYTVSDITIQGAPIRWGSQVVQTFKMQIMGMAFPATPGAALPCAGSPDVPLAQPLQLFHAEVFQAFASTVVPNVVNFPMNLLSNSTLIAPCVKAAPASVEMVLTGATVLTSPLPNLAFTFPDGTVDPNISARITGTSSVMYAVPGNTLPSENIVLSLLVTLAPGVVPGMRGVQITNAGQATAAPMQSLLQIVAA